MPSSTNPSRLCIDRMFMDDLIDAMHASSKSNACTRRRLVVSLGNILLDFCSAPPLGLPDRKGAAGGREGRRGATSVPDVDDIVGGQEPPAHRLSVISARRRVPNG